MTSIFEVWDQIIQPFQNVNGSTVEVWEWINFIPHCIMHVIIHGGSKVKIFRNGIWWTDMTVE